MTIYTVSFIFLPLLGATRADLVDGRWIGQVMEYIPWHLDLTGICRDCPTMLTRLVSDDQLRQLAQSV